MKCGARVAIGVAGGYFLGRTKKMKLALMLGAMAAGKQVGGPGELLGSASKLLGQSPELTALTDQVRGRLIDAGKGAAMAVASRQVEALTDRVGRRVESLGDLGAGKRAATEKLDDYAGVADVDSRNGSGDDDPPEDTPADTAEASNDTEAKPDNETEQPKRPSRRARASADSGGSGSGRSTSTRSGGTRRSTSRSSAPASESGGTAKRATAGTARRAAAGTAASARRTTTKATGQRRAARSTRSSGEESDG